MSERWLPVAGYEGAYEVSDLGRVRSIDRQIETCNGRRWTQSGRILQAVKRDVYGHLIVNLSSGNKGTSRQVHDLVLRAFVGAPSLGQICRHLNGNPGDNRIGNLAWGSTADNVRDKMIHGTHHYSRRTHCDNGHEFTAQNTLLRTDGGRRCRACKSVRDNEYRKRRSA